MNTKYKSESLKNLIKVKIKRNKLFNRYFGEQKKHKTYGTLSDEQMRYIFAFSEVIYPPSNQKEKTQLRRVILNWTKERTEIDGYFKEYRQFIDIIKTVTERKYANRKFYDLSSDEAIKLLDDLYHQSAIYHIPRARNPVTLFKFVILYSMNRKKYNQHFILKTVREDLIRGIFTSQLGWSLGGYQSMPGVRGDHTVYTAPPGLN